MPTLYHIISPFSFLQTDSRGQYDRFLWGFFLSAQGYRVVIPVTELNICDTERTSSHMLDVFVDDCDFD